MRGMSSRCGRQCLWARADDTDAVAVGDGSRDFRLLISVRTRNTCRHGMKAQLDLGRMITACPAQSVADSDKKHAHLRQQTLVLCLQLEALDRWSILRVFPIGIEAGVDLDMGRSGTSS